LRRIFRNLFFLVLHTTLLIILFFLTVGLQTPDVSHLTSERPAPTPLMIAREINHININQSWISYRSVPRHVRLAVVMNEDATFFQHSGIEWYEIRMSIGDYLFSDRRLRGASTITQQVAKNLFLSNDRSWLRKVKEYWLTIKLENALSKRRILEIYLNIAEWGPRVFGIQAASRYWYKKSASKLSYREAAAISSILPSPLKWSPHKPNRTVRNKTRRTLNYLYKLLGKPKPPARPLEKKAVDANQRNQLDKIEKERQRIEKETLKILEALKE
jgi:monofunctional biosynthetic peptidoglycan transglycosylase